MITEKLEWMPLERPHTKDELAMIDCRLAIRALINNQVRSEIIMLGIEPHPVTKQVPASTNWAESAPLPQEFKAWEIVLQRFNITLEDLAKDSNVNTIVPSVMTSLSDYIGKPVGWRMFVDAASFIICNRIYAGRV